MQSVCSCYNTIYKFFKAKDARRRILSWNAFISGFMRAIERVHVSAIYAPLSNHANVSEMYQSMLLKCNNYSTLRRNGISQTITVSPDF